MKIAAIDWLFNWSRDGGDSGARTDTFLILSGLARRGHDVSLIVPSSHSQIFPRGVVKTSVLPLPFKLLRVREGWVGNFIKGMEYCIQERLRRGHSFDHYMVFDSWYMKPQTIEMVAKYGRPNVRQYSYESFCPMAYHRVLNGQPCQGSIFLDTYKCILCGRGHYWQMLEAGPKRRDACLEYMESRAWTSDYRQISFDAHIKASITSMGSVVGKFLKKNFDDVQVIPGMMSCEFEVTDPENYIVIPGRCDDPIKGVRQTVRAIAQTTDYSIYITGSESVEGATSLGWLSLHAYRDLLRQARAVVVPSICEEGFGIVALDALTFGVPVIARNRGGLRDIVIHGVNGFLYNTDIDLVRYLVEIMEDTGARQRLVSNIPDTIKKFEPDIVLDQWEEVLE